MFKLISALLIAAALTGCSTVSSYVAIPKEGDSFFYNVDRYSFVKQYQVTKSKCARYDEYKYLATNFNYIVDCTDTIITVYDPAKATPDAVIKMRNESAQIEEAQAKEKEKQRLKAEKEAKAKEAREQAAAFAKLNATGGFVGGSYTSCDQANSMAASGLFSSNSLFGLGLAIERNRACAGGYYGASISGSITNTAKVARKDATVTCSLLAKSGTVLGSVTKVVYEKWAPAEKKNIWFNVQDMPNVNSASCRVTAFN